MDKLLNDTIISAGLDINFQIEINLKEISSAFLDDTPLGEAFASGVGLGISTWGAYVTFIVDPINLGFAFGGSSLELRDSHLAVSADIRSQGPYFATVQDIIDGETNSTQLIPTVMIPLSAEVVLDVNVAGYTISPILSISSDNVIDDVTFDFDVDLAEFINQFDLDALFGNLTDLLNEIVSYGPALGTGDTSTAVSGLLDVLGEAADFVRGLEDFKDLVQNGEASSHLFCFGTLDSLSNSDGFCLLVCLFKVTTLIPQEVRAVARHASLLTRDGCSDPSTSFIDYAFDLIEGSVVPAINRADFNPCNHINDIQQALGYIPSANPSSFEDLVVLPDGLRSKLEEFFGNETAFDSEFLLQQLGTLSVSAAITP